MNSLEYFRDLTKSALDAQREELRAWEFFLRVGGFLSLLSSLFLIFYLPESGAASSEGWRLFFGLFVFVMSVTLFVSSGEARTGATHLTPISGADVRRAKEIFSADPELRNHLTCVVKNGRELVNQELDLAQEFLSEKSISARKQALYGNTPKFL